MLVTIYTDFELPHKLENPEIIAIKSNANFMFVGLKIQSKKRLVADLEKHTSLSGRNISYDHLYTSISLAKWLLERNITTVGTLQANRKGIPEEVKHVGSRDSNSYEVFWDESGKLVLNSYIVNTKSSGKRNVLLLSTMHPILGTGQGQFTIETSNLKALRLH